MRKIVKLNVILQYVRACKGSSSRSGRMNYYLKTLNLSVLFSSVDLHVSINHTVFRSTTLPVIVK